MKICCRRGSNYPVEKDPNKIFGGVCGPRDGRMVQGTAESMPVFTLNVTNPVDGGVGDLLWTDEDFDVVVQDDDSFVYIDDI